MVDTTSFVHALKQGVVRYSKTSKFIPNLEIREVDGDGNCFWSSISVRASSQTGVHEYTSGVL
jgi:hypothetical protein